MRILVTGAGGQLGYDLIKELNKRGIENKGIDIATCDLTHAQQTHEVIAACRPDAVIHCAAYTAVDNAEDNDEVCRKVNVLATQNVANVCKEIGAKMMYISTDYVFSGEGEAPFEVDDPKAPQSVYGQTKYDGELAVQERIERYFIVRVSWVFGKNGNNFVKTMLRLGAEKEQLSVVSDQIGSPTYTPDLSRLLCDMIVTEKYGVYHASNEGYCSWFAFAREIMKQAQSPCTVTPVLTKDYSAAKAKRPLNSRLSKRSLDEAGFARLPAWEDALRRYLQEMRE